MKRRLPLLVLATASCTVGALGPLATPASAQIFDKLGKAAVQAKAAHDDLTFTDEEEQDLDKHERDFWKHTVGGQPFSETARSAAGDFRSGRHVRYSCADFHHRGSGLRHRNRHPKRRKIQR